MTHAVSGYPKCATCRHAEPLDERDLEFASEAEQQKHARYPLECVRARMDDGYPEDPQTLAFSMDGSTYRASLMVSPDFGCIMHEAKATEGIGQ